MFTSHSASGLPLRLRPLEAPKHCCAKDQSEAGYCGQLWLKMDSGAFWDWWSQTPNSTQCPGQQTLHAQLCIEFATNVGSVSIQDLSAVGRRVRLGIHLQFLPAFYAPVRMNNHRLVCGTSGVFDEAAESPANVFKDSCFFRFQLEMATSLQGKVRPPRAYSLHFLAWIYLFSFSVRVRFVCLNIFLRRIRKWVYSTSAIHVTISKFQSPCLTFSTDS
ncbi:unnamed protein product [Dibothriocephalus latus]|uniref:Uncharacterized protein n=1 Tax=Dibothriocephalus latus TaxID=60516 RepID=A0A3P6QRC7_DIBLA|nr:unnamed protein product [Dibothriocephalus latus]